MTLSTAAQTVEDFFAGGAKAAKFEDRAYGSVIGGEIVADPVMRQQRDYETDELMTYPDGNPMMQMLITVQAQPATEEDDGQRTFYVKGQLKQAVGEALRKAGEKVPRRGGFLWVKYVSDEPVTLKNGKRGNDKKIHAAKYEPPKQAAAGQFFAEGGPVTSIRLTPPADPAPPGVTAEAWAAMNPDQRIQMREALSGANRFTDEPPF